MALLVRYNTGVTMTYHLVSPRIAILLTEADFKRPLIHPGR